MGFFQYGGVAKSILIIAIMTSSIVTEIYVFKLILEIERLFKRINKSASPFSLENTKSLRKIVICIIVSQLLPTLTNLLIKIIMPENIVRINLPGLSLALIAIVLVYIWLFIGERKAKNRKRGNARIHIPQKLQGLHKFDIPIT